MHLDSYTDAGVLVAVELVNELALEYAGGKPAVAADPTPALKKILAFDRASLAQLHRRDAPAFVALAHRLREIFERLHGGDVDAAAAKLNEMLAAHPAHPHLAKEDGVWRLHHHPADVALVPMYTSICAEAIARMIGGGCSHRFGSCDAADCDRVFFDTSKNGTRRFCTTSCQNRTKTAAFRERFASRAAKASANPARKGARTPGSPRSRG